MTSMRCSPAGAGLGSLHTCGHWNSDLPLSAHVSPIVFLNISLKFCLYIPQIGERYTKWGLWSVGCDNRGMCEQAMAGKPFTKGMQLTGGCRRLGVSSWCWNEEVRCQAGWRSWWLTFLTDHWSLFLGIKSCSLLSCPVHMHVYYSSHFKSKYKCITHTWCHYCCITKVGLSSIPRSPQNTMLQVQKSFARFLSWACGLWHLKNASKN